MRSHLGLQGDVKQDTVPEETVLAVADVLRRSTALRVSEDGKLIISPFSSISVLRNCVVLIKVDFEFRWCRSIISSRRI